MAVYKKARARRNLAAACVLLAWLVVIGSIQSQPAQSLPPQPAGRPDFPLTQYKLKNGLTVIISEDNSLPLASVVVAYKAGSIYEQPGKSGLAALLENMMFTGSADVPPLQHISFISRVGGSLSAAVTEDRTVFYQTVPSNTLALALWLESDRMRFLEIDETRFEAARSQLLDDIRTRRRSEPYFEGLAVFDQMIHPDFAFGHPASGTEEDIQALTLEDAKAFYAAFYAPNNAVLCITGDVQKAKVREMVARYFDSLPRGRDLAQSFEPPPPPGRRPTVREVVDAAALTPAFSLGFRLSPSTSPEYHILLLLDYVLMRGRTSRLNRRLTDPDRRIAFRTAGGIDRRRERSIYKLFAQANPSQLEPSQAEIFDELGRIKGSLLSPTELDRYKALFRREHYRRIGTAIERALHLADLWLIQRDVEAAPYDMAAVLAVTPEDIVGLAARYFTPANSFVVNMRTR